MDRALFDWTKTANNVFITVLIAVMADATPVLGIKDNGDLLFGIGL